MSCEAEWRFEEVMIAGANNDRPDNVKAAAMEQHEDAVESSAANDVNNFILGIAVIERGFASKEQINIKK